MLAQLLPTPQKINIGQNEKLWGVILVGGGKKERAIIKLSAGDKLVTELALSTLARNAGIPTPVTYLTRINQSYLPSGVNSSSGYGIASVDAGYNMLSSVTRDDEETYKRLEKWSGVYDCAAFDTWCAVSDRLPDNLLCKGDKEFIVIDYDDGISDPYTPGYSGKNGIIRLLAANTDNTDELSRYRMKQELAASIAKFNDRLSWEELDTQMQPVASAIPGADKLLHGIKTFLSARLKHTSRIFSEQLGIRQRELFPVTNGFKRNEQR